MVILNGLEAEMSPQHPDGLVGAPVTRRTTIASETSFIAKRRL